MAAGSLAYSERALALMASLTSETVLDALRPRMNKLLTIAETALPPSQFQAYRKLFLSEMGRDGFEKVLREAEADLKHIRHG